MINFIKQNKTILILLAGVVMIGGDYLVSYYEGADIFLIGEVVSLLGWGLFVIALDTK